MLATILSAAVLLLGRIAEPMRVPASPRHPVLEIRDGARFVWRQAFLRPMLLTGVAWNISWFVLQVAYVPYAVRVLGLTAQGVGFESHRPAAPAGAGGPAGRAGVRLRSR